MENHDGMNTLLSEADELYHHGIKGQRWGVRRFQKRDGSLTKAGERRYNKEIEKLRTEKKHLDNRRKVASKVARLEAMEKSIDAGNKEVGYKTKRVRDKERAEKREENRVERAEKRAENKIKRAENKVIKDAEREERRAEKESREMEKSTKKAIKKEIKNQKEAIKKAEKKQEKLEKSFNKPIEKMSYEELVAFKQRLETEKAVKGLQKDLRIMEEGDKSKVFDTITKIGGKAVNAVWNDVAKPNLNKYIESKLKEPLSEFDKLKKEAERLQQEEKISASKYKMWSNEEKRRRGLVEGQKVKDNDDDNDDYDNDDDSNNSNKSKKNKGQKQNQNTQDNESSGNDSQNDSRREQSSDNRSQAQKDVDNYNSQNWWENDRVKPVNDQYTKRIEEVERYVAKAKDVVGKGDSKFEGWDSPVVQDAVWNGEKYVNASTFNNRIEEFPVYLLTDNMRHSMYTDDELYHFGIKGMKWGVHRFYNADGSRTAAGKKRENAAKRESTDRLTKKLEKRISYINKNEEKMRKRLSKNVSITQQDATARRYRDSSKKLIGKITKKDPKLGDELNKRYSSLLDKLYYSDFTISELRKITDNPDKLDAKAKKFIDQQMSANSYKETIQRIEKQIQKSMDEAMTATQLQNMQIQQMLFQQQIEQNMQLQIQQQIQNQIAIQNSMMGMM